MITAKKIREIIIKQSKRAHVGHIGSGLCIADILQALYEDDFVKIGQDLDRDRFILAKGHAALALYAVLFLKGILTEEDINTFCGDESFLSVHPEFQLKGIDFSTGSLGQGITFGVGSALAAKLESSQRKIVVLMSDAECNEGSVWESIMFAAQHSLSNLIVIVDVNGQQAIGYTKDILNLEPLLERWKIFGWNTFEVDGHNVSEIKQVLAKISSSSNGPSVILAKTIFGKGVSFMENQIKWHYWPMSDEEFNSAMLEL